MLTLPDLQTAELQFGLEIEMFATVCATHRVSCGAAEDLFAFPWQITSQPEFQADLAAFVGRIQRHGRLPDPFADVLSIFLIGIGGPSAAQAGLQFQSSTDMLINFLSSLEGWSEADLQYATELADQIRDELSQEQQTFDESQSPLSTEADREIHLDARVDPAPSIELHEVIARLEQSNQELRQKLEAMDERIRRIDPLADTSTYPPHARPQLRDPVTPVPEKALLDPTSSLRNGLLSHLEGLSRRASPPHNPQPSGIGSAAASNSARTPEASPKTSNPSEVWPAPAPGTTKAGTPGPDRQSSGAPRSGIPAATPNPLAPVRTGTRLLTDRQHLADQKRISAPLRRSRLVQAAVFSTAVLVAAGGVLYSSRNRPSASTPAENSQADPRNASSRGVGGVVSSTGQSGNTIDNDLSSTAEAPPPPPQHVTIYSANAKAQVTAGRTRHKPSAVTSEPLAGRGVPNPGQASSKIATHPADSSEPLSVSSSVMAERLLSSTPPSYPRLARLTSLQGVVVLRATIAKDGSVERVHALGGNYLLRGAAADAVRNWRYKPYYLNGRPVEVATLVTIDFALSR